MSYRVEATKGIVRLARVKAADEAERDLLVAELQEQYPDASVYWREVRDPGYTERDVAAVLDRVTDVEEPEKEDWE